ncbi:MAG: cobalamin biosynthesis protein [Devosia sp.]
MVDSYSHPVAGVAATGVVAGIGLRAGAQASDVLQLIDACLAEAGRTRADIAALATLDRKQAHPALSQAAATLGVPVLPVAATKFSAKTPNPSLRVARHIGIGSVAEAAAMQLGALVLEKRRGASVTCALARLDRSQEVTQPSAASVASTLSTSSAGP